jgi:hypothetical protein
MKMTEKKDIQYYVATELEMLEDIDQPLLDWTFDVRAAERNIKYPIFVYKPNGEISGRVEGCVLIVDRKPEEMDPYLVGWAIGLGVLAWAKTAGALVVEVHCDGEVNRTTISMFEESGELIKHTPIGPMLFLSLLHWQFWSGKKYHQNASHLATSVNGDQKK